MFDYSFFALLFLLATSLAPDAGAERAWINSRYPEQSITWTPEGEGWAMRVNGREMGIFHLDGDAVVHHTGQGEPHRFPVAALSGPVSRDARRIPLRGRFAPTVLAVERSGDEVRLVDAGRELLRVPLILSSR
ncbi:MAG: hypothetical protein KC619_13345 [Myxococcales bacterium]|nr:hypothetical protein [Myxococcales bacterium]